MTSLKIEDATPWQKLIQHKSFTQDSLKLLLESRLVTKKEKQLLEVLVSDKRCDGIHRELMQPFVRQLRTHYKDTIPSYFWKRQDPEQIISHEEILLIIQELLQDIHADNWQIQTRTKSSIFSVNRLAETVNIPNKSMNALELQAILAHEIMGHVMRWTSNQLVLKHYKLFEEGLATSLQFYILGEKIIPYGRNKMKDLLIFLSESGIEPNRIEKFFDILVPLHNFNERRTKRIKLLIHRLENNLLTTKGMRRYKIYALGVRRFERFLKRFSSRDPETAALALQLTNTMLGVKFDALRPQHLEFLNEHGYIHTKLQNITTFCQKQVFDSSLTDEPKKGNSFS